MKVKIYVNWYSREIISEKDFKEKVEEATQDYKEDECFFSEWLNEHYSTGEIWNLDEDRRREVRSDYLVKCERLAVEDVRGDWEEKEIEI